MSRISLVFVCSTKIKLNWLIINYPCNDKSARGEGNIATLKALLFCNFHIFLTQFFSPAPSFIRWEWEGTDKCKLWSLLEEQKAPFWREI